MDNQFKFPISKCPYCGGGTVAVRQYIHGYGTYYVNLDDGEMDGSCLHDNIDYKNTGKYVLCADCGKRLFKVDERLNVID